MLHQKSYQWDTIRTKSNKRSVRGSVQYGIGEELNQKVTQIEQSNKNLNTKTGPFTNSECENVRKQIKGNKATGRDGISPDVLKQWEISDTTSCSGKCCKDWITLTFW